MGSGLPGWAHSGLGAWPFGTPAPPPSLLCKAQLQAGAGAGPCVLEGGDPGARRRAQDQQQHPAPRARAGPPRGAGISARLAQTKAPREKQNEVRGVKAAPSWPRDGGAGGKGSETPVKPQGSAQHSAKGAKGCPASSAPHLHSCPYPTHSVYPKPRPQPEPAGTILWDVDKVVKSGKCSPKPSWCPRAEAATEGAEGPEAKSLPSPGCRQGGTLCFRVWGTCPPNLGVWLGATSPPNPTVRGVRQSSVQPPSPKGG